MTDDYSKLREVIHPEIARLPAEQLEATLERYNIDAEAMENWLSTLGGIAQAVLPIAGKVVGTVYGGPVGATVGGYLGSLAGGAVGSLTGQQPSAPAQTPQVPPSSFPPGGVAPLPPGSQVPGASPAAGQLMQTMLRPETMQALMAMLMGQLGRPNVQVGATPVPVGAFSNLLGTLANQAASEYNAATSAAREAVPEYMRDYAGEAVGDPAVTEHRARALSELLQRTEIEQETDEATGESPEHSRFVSEIEAIEREYDAMELAELYETSDHY